MPGLHVRLESAAAACRVIDAALETPLRLAVITAVAVPDAIAPTVAVKLAEVEPTGTVTEGGTVTELWLSETEIRAPPEGAGPLSVMVQVLELGGVTTSGLQMSAPRSPAGVPPGTWGMVIRDPTPVSPTALPFGDTALEPVICMAETVSLVDAAIEIVALATTPELMLPALA